MKSSTDTEIKLETFTPEQAQGILEESERRRKLPVNDPDFVAQRDIDQEYALSTASDICKGDWKPRMRTVHFLRDSGVVGDGRHFFKAVALAGIPTPVMVNRSMTNDERLVVDRGRPRRDGQQLTMIGVSEGADKAAVVNIIMESLFVPKPKLSMSEKAFKVQLKQFVRAFSNITRILKEEKKKYTVSGKGVDSAVARAAFVLTWLTNETDVESLYLRFLTGVGIKSANDPISRARTLLNASNYSSGSNRPTVFLQLVTLIDKALEDGTAVRAPDASSEAGKKRCVEIALSYHKEFGANFEPNVVDLSEQIDTLN